MDELGDVFYSQRLFAMLRDKRVQALNQRNSIFHFLLVLARSMVNDLVWSQPVVELI